MGVGRYTPNVAVHGDSGWQPTVVRQWSSVINQWIRVKSMSDSKINFRIFEWCERNSGHRCKNLNYRVNMMFQEAGITMGNSVNSYREIKTQVTRHVFDKFKSEWLQDVNREGARHGHGKNKLRIYSKYKQEFQSETYLECSMSRAHRSSYAKFRCGVAPIRVETGRYERLNYDDRTCFNCHEKIENEEDVLLECPLYQCYRESLYDKLSAEFPDILSFTNEEKLSAILSCQNFESIRYCAKICHSILMMRRDILYK